MCLGIPGRVIEITEDAAMPMGIVDFGGVTRETCLAYVADEVSIGNYVIVHAGFAISILDEEEAQRTLELFAEIGELENADRQADVAAQNLDSEASGTT